MYLSGLILCLYGENSRIGDAIMSSEGGIHHHARGEYREPSLSHRTLHFQKGISAEFHHFFFLLDGSATIRTQSADERLMRGQSIASLPAQQRCELTIAAGGHGFLIGASPHILVDAIGERVESYSLRILTQQLALINSLQPGFTTEVRPLFAGYTGELREPGRASWMMVSAYLRLILMSVWRADGTGEADLAGRSAQVSILQRYRQLVEGWFLQHRPITEYARQLGMTTDRLHAICRRELGRSPIQLLHERMIQEARLRLERSDHSIQKISDALGFRDPTYFNRFFTARAGHTPLKYRQLVRKSVGADNSPSSDYADWP
jgi:AraC-like DNA-binding protein